MNVSCAWKKGLKFAYRTMKSTLMKRGITGRVLFTAAMCVVCLYYMGIKEHLTADTRNEKYIEPSVHVAKKELMEDVSVNVSNKEEDDIKERMDRINDTCQNMMIPGKISQLIVYAPTKVAYCSAHKVASSYWLQVFRFLFKDVPRNVSRPQDLSKYNTHIAKFKTTRFLQYSNPITQKEISNYFRFMMTRDPYKRLWSVYIDKFVLVDQYFWTTYAPPIRRTYVRDFGTVGTPDDERHKPHSAATINSKIRFRSKCLHISFTEFLHFVAEYGTRNPASLNDHMQPVHWACNPCLFKPQFVGKVETMTSEKNRILGKLNIPTNDISSFNEHVENEVKFAADFQFDQVYKHHFQSNCVSYLQLQERLLHAYVLNGYLTQDSAEKLKVDLPIKAETFVQKVMEVIRASNISEADSSALRRQYRTKAYRNVPLSILLKLQKVYEYDFALFGYVPFPDYIFDR